jgi:hypothetical protein
MISFGLGTHRDDLAITKLFYAGHVKDINKMYYHLYAY